MKNIIRAKTKGGKKPQSSQAQKPIRKSYYPASSKDVIRRSIGYDLVLNFIDDFQRLEQARDEVRGLLALGVDLLRLHSND